MAEPFSFTRTFTLAEAVDALSAFDGGATDSGISDSEMRAAVKEYLNGFSPGESAQAIADTAAELADDDDEEHRDEIIEWMKAVMEGPSR